MKCPCSPGCKWESRPRPLHYSLHFYAGILKNRQNFLQSFLPDCTHLQYQLRQRSHNKIMTSKTVDLNDRDVGL